MELNKDQKKEEVEERRKKNVCKLLVMMKKKSNAKFFPCRIVVCVKGNFLLNNKIITTDITNIL